MMLEVYHIGASPTIEMILRHMQAKYPSDITTTFVLVWANKNFPQAAKEILDNAEYIHLRSNDYIDFFFPGYLPKINISEGEEWNIFHSWEFNTEDFVRAIEYVENVSRWRYSGNSEFLFLEYSAGKIVFENSISLNIDYLLKNKMIDSLSSLMENIIRISKSYVQVSDFSRELGYLEAKESIIEAVKKYLSAKLKGVHIGTFRCRNLELK